MSNQKAKEAAAWIVTDFIPLISSVENGLNRASDNLPADATVTQTITVLTDALQKVVDALTEGAKPFSDVSMEEAASYLKDFQRLFKQ